MFKKIVKTILIAQGAGVILSQSAYIISGKIAKRNENPTLALAFHQHMLRNYLAMITANTHLDDREIESELSFILMLQDAIFKK